MYVSTVMIIFEESKTEPVGSTEWRTVASFMGEAGDDESTTMSVSGDFVARVGWKTTDS